MFRVKKSHLWFILALLLILILLFFYQKNLTKGNILDFVYGDKFQGFDVISVQNEKIEHPPHLNKNCLVIYLSESCGGCTKLLRSVNLIDEVFSSDQLSIIIYWQNKIPLNLLEKYNVRESINFSLSGMSRLDTMVPSLFLINSQNQVMFKTNDPSLMIEKMIQDNLMDKEDVILRSNQYIVSNYIQNDNKKVNLIFFSMEGCPDCLEAEEILKSEKLKNYFNITRIYRDNDVQDDKLIDQFSIFQKIYAVEWYPSFLVLSHDDTYRFIGEIPLDLLEIELLKE